MCHRGKVNQDIKGMFNIVQKFNLFSVYSTMESSHTELLKVQSVILKSKKVSTHQNLGFPLFSNLLKNP